MNKKDGVRRHKDGGRRRTARLLPSALCSSFVLHPASFCLAAPTQEEVLRSIGQNVGESADAGKVLAAVFCLAAVVILLVVVNLRRKREVVPRALNHPRRLLREIARSANLKPAEIRQLKLLAMAQGVSSPLTLLLCPSLLAKAVRESGAPLDRSIIEGVAWKATGTLLDSNRAQS